MIDIGGDVVFVDINFKVVVRGLVVDDTRTDFHDGVANVVVVFAGTRADQSIEIGLRIQDVVGVGVVLAPARIP